MARQTLITAVLAAFITLLALSPVAYVAYRNLPPSIATVDLQQLVEEAQQRNLSLLTKEGSGSEEQRAQAARISVDFAKKLSGVVEALGQECQCVIVNKAALLAGVSADYTARVRERMK